MARDSGQINLWQYPLEVTKLRSRWLEDGQRRRTLIDSDDLDCYRQPARVYADGQVLRDLVF